MNESQFGLLIACFAVGMLGVLLGAWKQQRSHRAQLDAQSHAFDLARGQVSRDLQRALLCVPQSMQQSMRIELEFLGRQQAERWKEQLREQCRWQAEQDALRRAEWQTLLRAFSQLPGTPPAVVVPPVRPAPSQAPAVRAPAPRPAPVPPSPRPPEWTEAPLRQPAAAMVAPEEPERQLSDAEIDALPPDLPAPSRFSGRKLPAPKGPTLRNI